LIERQFISQNIKEYRIKEFVAKSLTKAGLSNVKLVKTPLGEKIVISASKPGLVVGRSGANIAKLTKELKKRFSLENPQIELDEVANPHTDANIIAETIANALERFGSARFKGIGHKAMTEVMGAGAMGVEILISGKIPSSRAKTWRFYQGYLKKCGDLAIEGVRKASVQANLKSGVVGIKVRIMPADIVLPDRIRLRDEVQTIVEETDAEADKNVKSEKSEIKEIKEKSAKKETKPKEKTRPAEKKEEKKEDKKAKQQKKIEKSKPKKK